MHRVLDRLFLEHDLRIVAVAAVICLLACFTTFLLVEQVRREGGRRRLAWLAASGFVSGTGIWATHFIAMLAYRPNMNVAYDVERTLLSIVVAIVLTGAGWWLSLSERRFSSISAGTIVGIGIASMHYIGMDAMIMAGRIAYATDLIVASVFISVGLSVAAVVVRSRRAARNRYILPWPATVLFTLAICGMHFTGMGAATMVAGPGASSSGAIFTGRGLTVAVSLMALAILAIGLVAVIAERKLQQQAAAQEHQLKSFADAAIEGLILTDGLEVIKANRSFLHTAGYSDLASCPNLLSDLFPDLNVAQLPVMIDSTPTECELATANGERCPIEALSRPFENEKSNMFILAVRDIRERKEAAARIAHLAYHDALTGLPNRAVFSDHLKKTLEKARRRRVALLCLDLDGFKAVNDLYGHPSGDELLVQTSQRLRTAAGEHCLVARLGGDEFAIVQQGGAQPRHAGQLADKVIAALNEPFDLQEQSVRIGCSVGIAIYPSDATTGSSLVKNADLALYRAKSEGGRLARFYEIAMDEAMQQRRQMEAELKLALGRDEFEVYYQPVADLDAGVIIGFEALLRWTHPVQGMISPEVFIPLAEECGHIDLLGEWVLRQACGEAAGWEPPLRLSVNLSPLQFLPNNFVEMVRKIIAETGMDPRRLDLEVTEGLLIKDADKAIEILRELKDMGVQISMDDFGTGYASLSYFRMFPFDKVKIDRSFIKDMMINPQALAIIRSVIGLGHGLNMPVIAEGVETVEQLDALKAEGCTQVQGYLISRPQPIGHFERLLLDRGRGSGEGAYPLRAAG